MRGYIKIELLSDLCVTDGGVYNSSLDVDICQEPSGLPYIPAKRIRGCLRECALELADWGEDISPEELFGREGREKGRIRISSARIEHYDQIMDFLRRNNDSVILHPLNVLQHFTYVRAQTSIDQETGTAEQGSLRTMRVVSKGNVFFAPVEADDSLWESLRKCCSVCCHLGLERTRGLGEVNVTLQNELSEKKAQTDLDEEGKPCPLLPGSTRMDYKIYLEEPVIFKSPAGGEAKTQDFIEGSRILGMAIGRLERKGISYDAFMQEGKVRFSDAFISDGSVRFQEIPANIYGIKNQKNQYIDALVEKDTASKGLMPVAMKHSYIHLGQDGTIYKKNVITRMRYHHRRADDKAVGRAESSSDDAALYQLSSIAEGQTFMGYVTGSPEQIRQLYGLFTEEKAQLLGYGRSSEYGRVRLSVTETSRPEERTVSGKAFLFRLLSPAIVYSRNAFYSTNKEDLLEEILAYSGLEDTDLVKGSIHSFLNYTTIGGFNVTWGMRKPTLEAFDKGTVLFFTTEQERELPATGFIGERTSEGYGEFEVLSADKLQAGGSIVSVKSTVEAKQVNERKPLSGGCSPRTEVGINVADSSFGQEIVHDLLLERLQMEAIEQAGIFVKESNDSDKLRPTVSNMLLMVSDAANMNNPFDFVCQAVKSRYEEKTSLGKMNKGIIAGKILDKTKMVIPEPKNSATDQDEDGAVQRFTSEYGISGYREDVDELRYEFLKAFLQNLKYEIRDKKEAGMS
ncbi:MAG: RAMP superfamily CRISPR-associated protein [Bilifractor sp.]